MLNILRKFFAFSGEVNKKKFEASIVLGIVEAFCQALRIPAIYLIVRGMVEGKLTGRTVWMAFGILVAGVLLQITVSGKGKMLQTEAGYTTCANKRIEIASHLKYLPMGYFNNNSLGYITSVTTNTMESLADVATRVVMMTLQGVLEAVLITIFLYFFDWRIGVVATVGILLFFLANRITQKRSAAMSPRKLKADTGVVEQVLEFIQGIAEAKSYNMTVESNRKLEDAIDEASKVCTDMELGFVPILAIQTWLIKMTGVAMCALSLKFCFDGSMTVPECIVMMIASFIVFAALESAGNYSALLRTVDMSVDKANGILATEEMDIEGKDIVPTHCDITMRKVDFAYDKRKIVDNVSLQIPEKTSAAFVGPSGGGKTTICHLIARFWDVEKGEVLLDGLDVREYSMDSLMENYSFVFQNVYLFHDTIANNIRFGQPDAPMEKVIEAAKKACCDEFIRALPDGYDTIIGEGGESLSGGEKQRISIARAIMKDAPIIILDEATANVDPENEKELMEAIRSLTQEKTVLMIAHRLKTVRHADQIFVIDKGQIVQQGKHEELMQQEGIYRSFVSERKQAVSWKLAGQK
ncbi:MAG: ABC transporter ATP-binding protein [Lachnospiraceae bacterium]|nr:ABC transporter ATP-binding protein [Lachnospiraceae bacterium]